MKKFQFITLVFAIGALAISYTFSAPPVARHEAKTASAAKASATQPVLLSAAGLRNRYEAGLKTAREKYIRDLKQLSREAMQSDDLDGANYATSMIKQAEESGTDMPKTSSIPARESTGATTLLARMSVKAALDWQRGPEVHRGDVLTITANGVWCVEKSARAIRTCDADGCAPDGKPMEVQMAGLLLARVGPKIYCIGKKSRIDIISDGTLEFRVNDSIVGDNDGELTVSIFR